MPDELITREIGNLRSSLDRLSRRLENVQKELERQLKALGKQITTYIDEDRAARSRQFALTALVDARAEHDRQFGHRQMVRRSTTGMLRVMTTGMVRPAAFLQAAEQLMVDASDYWLSPAQVALAAWTDDSPVLAGRAVLEAVSRDPARSTLFFGLVLARFGRQAAAADWIAEYARAQDCNALTEEFTAVLDAVVRGALGGQARERLLDACRTWQDQLGQSGERQAKQVASWTEFIRSQRRPLVDKFQPLGTVSRDWVATLRTLEAAAAFGHTEQWLKSRLGSESEDDEILPAGAADLLRRLIAAPDQAEGALLEAARRWQGMIEHDDSSPASAGGELDEPILTDFLTLSTAIATGTHASQLSDQTVRFCLALSRTSAERAVTDLSQQVRRTHPASIEVNIEGWRYAIEPGDDPDALIQKFLGWAQNAMTEEKAQAARKRLSIGRTTRLEHIEGRWEALKPEGRERVHLATTQANLFFQKWEQGIAAAARCVDLLRAQPARVWSDTQESRMVPESAWPTMKLPDWDPRPPAPS